MSRDREHSRRREMAPGHLFGGLLIVVLGVVFLLNNLDIIEGREVLRFWPVLLIAAGVSSLIGSRGRGVSSGGMLLAAAGGFLLLNNLQIIDVDLRDIWPIILIVIGLQIAIRAFTGPAPPAERRNGGSSSFAFLGGVTHRNNSTPFRGGVATAIMGGVELDLSKASMEGDRAVLDIFVLMGGVEIRIPDAWTLESRIVPILGGVEDRSAPPAGPGKHLVLRGTALLGGVEIKN